MRVFIPARVRAVCAAPCVRNPAAMQVEPAKSWVKTSVVFLPNPSTMTMAKR